MADPTPHPPEGGTTAATIIEAAVFGGVLAVCLWLLTEHDQQASELLNILIGKVKTWVH